MTIEVKHKKVSAIADSGDTDIVQPSDWNDTHEIQLATAKLIGRTTAGAGQAEEISVGDGLNLSGLSISFDTTWGDSRYVQPDDVGTAAHEDVTTSATDTTAGRLLKVGDFGVGVALSPNVPSAPLPVSGSFAGVTTTDGYVDAPFGAIGYSYIQEHQTGYSAQFALSLNNSRLSFRSFPDASAETAPWREVVFSDSPALTDLQTTLDTKQANWDTAYGWGNHASAGYALSSSLDTALSGKAPLASPTFTGTVTLPATDGTDAPLTRVMLKDTGTVFYNSDTTSTLNYTNGSHQRWAPTGSATLAVTDWPPTGNLGELLIEGVNLGAVTITWPTVNWVKSDGTSSATFGDTGVTLQASGVDFILLWTRDAGTTVYGKVMR